MTHQPFAPLDDEARWKKIYTLLLPLQPGAVLDYDTIGRALGLDGTGDRQAIQMATRRALKELLEQQHRTCESVRNVGYRVVEPAQHLILARGRNRRARRQMAAGYNVATKVDLSAVAPQVREALEVIANGFARQMEINKRITSKQAKQQEAIDLLMQRVEVLEGKEKP